MPTDTRAEEVAAEQQQQEPRPSSDQKVPEAESAEEVQQPQAEKQVAEMTEPEESASDYQLPEEVKKRTQEQFEKLLEENRRLKEQVEQIGEIKQEEPVYQPNYQMAAPPSGVDAGSLAWQKLQQLEEQQAFEKYPELNPNEKDKFDRDFSEKVEALLLHSYVNPHKYGGRELSFLEAADRVKSWVTKDAEAAKKEGAKEAVRKLTPKEQASLEATGRSDRRQQTYDMSELQRQTREGKLNAVVERLKKSGL